MIKRAFFPLLLGVMMGAIGSSVALTFLTFSQLLIAVAITTVLISIPAIVMVAVDGVSAPQLSPLWNWNQYGPVVSHNREAQRRRIVRSKINWWDSEHIAAGYLGG